MHRRLLIVSLLLPAAACASAQAKAPVEIVSLDVPAVPPRVIDPVPIEAPPIPPVDDLSTPAPAPAPVKPRQRPDANRTEPKTEVKPEPDPDPTPPPAPVAPLRTGPLANGPEVERQIRDALGRTKALLDGLDPRAWSEDRKAAFESAKDSVTRAEDALRASNVVLARSLAERAENIAKLLVSRQTPD